MNRIEIVKKYGETYLVFACMQKFGGGFIVTLGELIQKADSNNLQKIKETWPEYWMQYLNWHIDLIQKENRVL